MGGFTILQCLIILTHVSLLVIAYDVLKEEEKISQLSMLILNFVLSAIHLSVLFSFIIRYPRMAILTTMGASDSSESNLTVSVNSGGHLKKGGGVGYHRQSLSSHGSSVRSNGTIRECAPGQRYVDGEWENLHCWFKNNRFILYASNLIRYHIKYQSQRLFASNFLCVNPLVNLKILMAIIHKMR